MTEKGPLRVALVGFGKFGTVLGKLIAEEVPSMVITALAEPSEGNRNRAFEMLGSDLPAFPSLEALLGKALDLIDGVVLTSPNHLHRDQAIAAARAGKHVFCEKPMALTGCDCRRMVKAAQENDVRLMVGHKRRLRQAWKRLTEIAHSGEIGRPVAININGWHTHPGLGPWWLKREGGGGLLHLAGVHDIDYMNAVMDEPAWVSALAGPKCHPDSNFPDTTWVNIGYRDGGTAGLQVSLWYAPKGFNNSFHVQLLGTDGGAFLQRYQKDRQELTWGREGATLRSESFVGTANLAYIEELSSFARWVKEGATPVLTWREGWRTVQMMQAAYRSAEAGGERIELEELPWP